MTPELRSWPSAEAPAMNDMFCTWWGHVHAAFAGSHAQKWQSAGGYTVQPFIPDPDVMLVLRAAWPAGWHFQRALLYKLADAVDAFIAAPREPVPCWLKALTLQVCQQLCPKQIVRGSGNSKTSIRLSSDVPRVASRIVGYLGVEAVTFKVGCGDVQAICPGSPRRQKRSCASVLLAGTHASLKTARLRGRIVRITGLVRKINQRAVAASIERERLFSVGCSMLACQPLFPSVPAAAWDRVRPLRILDRQDEGPIQPHAGPNAHDNDATNSVGIGRRTWQWSR